MLALLTFSHFRGGGGDYIPLLSGEIVVTCFIPKCTKSLCYPLWLDVENVYIVKISATLAML